MLKYYFGWNVPWGIFSVLLTAGAVLMMVRGVGVSTKLAGLFFAFEMLVLVVVSVAALIKNGGHLSRVPFEPSHITNGFSGLAAGFPLAVYLFIGWENSAALAEETDNPRRNVPRAVFLSIAMMAVGLRAVRLRHRDRLRLQRRQARRGPRSRSSRWPTASGRLRASSPTSPG